jgi:hypothetical protein
MNERIKELAEQATTYIEPTATSGEGWIFDKEKFAESIVWECMLICEDVMKKDNSALGCWSEIKRKFRS